MKIEIANKSDIDQLLFIANEAFGNNFITTDDLEDFITQPYKNCYIAVLNNEILGFITTEICNSNQLKESLLIKTDETFFPKSIASIGSIKQVAVNPKHLRKGIATSLLEHAITQLKLKSDTLFCISCKKGDVTPMSNLLLKNNFSLLQTIPNYWHTDSLTQKYTCSICGAPPCKCSAELYLK